MSRRDKIIIVSLFVFLLTMIVLLVFVLLSIHLDTKVTREKPIHYKEVQMADYGKKLSKGKRAQTIQQRAPKKVAGSGSSKTKPVKGKGKGNQSLTAANAYFAEHGKYKDDTQRNAIKADIKKMQAKQDKKNGKPTKTKVKAKVKEVAKPVKAKVKAKVQSKAKTATKPVKVAAKAKTNSPFETKTGGIPGKRKRS